MAGTSSTTNSMKGPRRAVAGGVGGRLRLAGTPPRRFGSPVEEDQPIHDTADPRWVLALRVAEQLEGSILSPDKRDRLVRMGKMLGLTAFDANLIIAIVQDQARRGHVADYCATAGEAQLRMVPRPTRAGWVSMFRGTNLLHVAALIAGLLALELWVLRLVF